MPTQFSCPSCKKVLKTSNPALAGKMIRCPHCQTPCRVPASEEAVTPSAPVAKTEAKAAPKAQPAAKPEVKPAPKARPAAKAPEEAVTPTRRPAPPPEDEDDSPAPPKSKVKKAKGGSGVLIGLLLWLLLLVGGGAAAYFALGDIGDLGPLLGIAIAAAVLGLFMAGFFLAAWWKLFTKAGEPGWAILVPIYPIFVLARICGRSPAFGLLYMIPCIGPFILPFDLAAAFGKKTAFALGLFFLGGIFLPILAFGSAEHVPPQRSTSRRKGDEDEEG